MHRYQKYINDKGRIRSVELGVGGNVAPWNRIIRIPKCDD